MKFAWMEAHSSAFALSEMCAVLDVSLSGYRIISESEVGKSADKPGSVA